MHIFTDESGDRREGIFIVAGIRMDPGDAGRLIKRIRRTCNISGMEVKGSALTASQRRKALTLLAGSACRLCANVCTAVVPPGGWALDQLPEHELWSEMTIEVVEALGDPVLATAYVSLDGGRYPRKLLEICRKQVQARLLRRTSSVTVSLVSSHSVAGVQLADLVANAVYRRETGRASPEELGLMAKLPIEVLGASLRDVRPAWLPVGSNDKAAPDEAALQASQADQRRSILSD